MDVIGHISGLTHLLVFGVLWICVLFVVIVVFHCCCWFLRYPGHRLRLLFLNIRQVI